MITAVVGRMQRRIALAMAAALLFLPLGLGPVRAGAEPAPLSGMLAGRTLSAVIYVRRPAWIHSSSELTRFMFQAYLRADGSALVRVWDEGRDAYTRPAERVWSVSETKLCVGLPHPGPDRICARVHVWGPRIAGIGIRPYVMLDGDVEPGDTMRGAR